MENIAYDAEGTTSISSDGIYQLGVITGTVTGEYESGFLGTKAREQNRLAKIAACRKEMERLENEMTAVKEKINKLEDRIKILDEEYQSFPGNQDLREAYRMFADAMHNYDREKAEISRIEVELGGVNAQLQEIKKEALQSAERLYLPCTLGAFENADASAGTYSQHFYQVKSGHEVYLQLADQTVNFVRHLEDLDEDLDGILYEKGTVTRSLKKEQEEYDSVKEQLALTDYDEIKERLDYCLAWLNDYPDTMKEYVKERTQIIEHIKVLHQQIEQGTERMKQAEKNEQYLGRCYLAERDLSYVDISEGGSEAADVVKLLEVQCRELKKETVIQSLNQVYFENKGFLNDYQLMQTELFEDLDQDAEPGSPIARRLDIGARYQGVRISFGKLLLHLEEDIAELEELIKDGDRELFEDILSNIVSRKIRGKINASNAWVDKMNRLMGAMNTSSGLKLSLHWRSRTAENEDQLDTKELVDLLKKDYRLMREEEAEKLSLHFRSKVDEARHHAKDSGGTISFYQVMRETLDYRKWFEFQLFSQKGGEKTKELTNSVFGTFSGGEKAMSMYVPLFSAVVAKYQGGRSDAPRIISLDEAFAGVDNKNIRDMFRLMTEFQFNFIINSQVLWGDCDTLDALAIYQLLRPENAKFVTVMPYLWNGKIKEMLEDEEQLEERAQRI